ncbi:macrophage migration inhibitory factor homolog [Tachypleus tridentatus]|uniref:macrophage migration inhibitory factor homolog n=1 Tax=Tachypleus tridentatus TaxID=6853 RepID=UPI003FD0B84D
MPVFTLNTNLPKDKIPCDFFEKRLMKLFNSEVQWSIIKLTGEKGGRAKQRWHRRSEPGCSPKSEEQISIRNDPIQGSYVVVHVNTNQLISFGGDNEPCALATLMSIGALGRQENKKHSVALYKHIEKTLGITRDKQVWIHILLFC